jgi:drug/metabolite transporter (DMT)-like permease
MKNDLLLITTALIWGLAFVAQRIGMQFIEPLAFNGIRFALGSVMLIPVWYLSRKYSKNKVLSGRAVKISIGAGFIIFAGATLQQIGIIYTTAGNAGFITSLYVVMVPIFGLFLKQSTGINTWIGAVLAFTGLYFLSVNQGFSISPGDFLVLLSAFFWTVHFHYLSGPGSNVNSILLSSIQFGVCSVLSIILSLIFENTSCKNVSDALIPILYGGILSVGVAYTLQVVAQKKAHPAHAAIILSLEGAFAAFGGWLILGETLSLRSIAGCFLIFCGMVISQLQSFHRKSKKID